VAGGKARAKAEKAPEKKPAAKLKLVEGVSNASTKTAK
jgi:hypothetical protein